MHLNTFAAQRLRRIDRRAVTVAVSGALAVAPSNETDAGVAYSYWQLLGRRTRPLPPLTAAAASTAVGSARVPRAAATRRGRVTLHPYRTHL